MSDKTLTDLKIDAHIAVLHTKVDALVEKQKELTERVRANEKVVAAVSLLGTVVIAIISAGYFAPKAEAHFNAGDLIQKIRDWKSKEDRTPVEEMLNNTLTEYEYGSDGSTESEELLQLPSDRDQQSS
tara:strand:- start:258 stop:641 length:384 start_codon:yes stop_codon:yes gene_type:complete